MNYSLLWNDEATDDVDDAWFDASPQGREQIVASLTVLSNLLCNDPMQVGESRQNAETGVTTHTPITVHFRVIERLKLVRVFAARVYS